MISRDDDIFRRETDTVDTKLGGRMLDKLQEVVYVRWDYASLE